MTPPYITFSYWFSLFFVFFFSVGVFPVCYCSESSTSKTSPGEIEFKCGSIEAAAHSEGNANIAKVCSTQKFQVENKNVALPAIAAQPPASQQILSFVCTSKFSATKFDFRVCCVCVGVCFTYVYTNNILRKATATRITRMRKRIELETFSNFRWVENKYKQDNNSNSNNTTEQIQKYSYAIKDSSHSHTHSPNIQYIYGIRWHKYAPKCSRVLVYIWI